MADVVAILGELIKRLNQMNAEYVNISQISAHHRTNLDKYMLAEIDKWVRGTGSTFGHLVEFEKYHKHRVIKRRVVDSAKGKGDVVVGVPGDPYAKTIQSKAVTSESHGSVDNHLQKAMEQIAGFYNEKARPNDHLVVSITILNDANSWPFTPAELNAPPDIKLVLSRIALAVKNNVESVLLQTTTKAANLLKNNLERTPYVSFVKPGPKSPALFNTTSRQVFDPARGQVAQDIYHVVPTFYVKFEWVFGYSVLHNGFLRLLRTVVVRYNPTSKMYEVARVDFFP
jgi:hypothetical protein